MSTPSAPEYVMLHNFRANGDNSLTTRVTLRKVRRVHYTGTTASGFIFAPHYVAVVCVASEMIHPVHKFASNIHLYSFHYMIP